MVFFRIILILIILGLLTGCSIYGVSVNEITFFKEGGAAIKINYDF